MRGSLRFAALPFALNYEHVPRSHKDRWFHDKSDSRAVVIADIVFSTWARLTSLGSRDAVMDPSDRRAASHEEPASGPSYGVDRGLMAAQNSQINIQGNVNFAGTVGLRQT